MRKTAVYVAMTTFLCVLLPGCIRPEEQKAQEQCTQAKSLAQGNPAQSIGMFKKMWEELPTTGTAQARICGREFRKKMGLVRSAVSRDETGEEETVLGCEWVMEMVDAFRNSVNPPFRMTWAVHLLADCKIVVGRAWARDPDSFRYMRLNEKMDQLLSPPLYSQ